MGGKAKKLGGYLGWLLFGILLVILASDWQKFKAAIAEADARYLALSFVLSIVSISFAALCFATAARVFGIGSPWHRRFQAGWLGTAANNLLMSGGVVGYGMRIKLLAKSPEEAKKVIGASLFQSFMIQAVMAMLLAFSFLYFYLHNLFGNAAVRHSALIGSALAFAGLAAFGSVIFKRSVRRRALSWLGAISKRALNKDIEAGLASFDEIANKIGGKGNLPRISLLFAFSLLDWLAFLSAFYAAFLAANIHAPFLFIFSSIVIAVAVGYVSVLPGGLGAQDLSLAGILALAGYPLAQAAIGVVLFRLLFYILPFGLALLFFDRSKMKKLP